MLRESRIGKRYLHWVENRPVQFFHRLALHPNQLSFAALVLGLAALPAYSYALWLGGLVVLFSGLLDTIDGGLARKTGRSSPSGAFLDSVLDRYCDFFSVLGLWLFFFFHPTEHSFPITLLLYVFLAGSFMVSYTRARGEGLGLSTSVGFFGRAERVIFLGLGSVLSAVLKAVFPEAGWASDYLLLIVLLVFLALGTHWTAIQRIIFLYKGLKP
ncbi:MAG: CDP-alcohol phosphatidyltransferase family protein [Thermodesulfobacteriota bacterium]